MSNVFDKPNAEGKSRSVCTILRLENDCFKETNLFATHYLTFPSSSFADISILLKENQRLPRSFSEAPFVSVKKTTSGKALVVKCC